MDKAQLGRIFIGNLDFAIGIIAAFLYSEKPFRHYERSPQEQSG